MGKVMIKTDCFAMVGKKCSALKVKDCKECGFYKTKKEANRSRKKALLRVLSLDEAAKDYIIDKYYMTDKYYDGHMGV